MGKIKLPKSYWNLPEPILLRELPKVKLDIQGMLEYSRAQGKDLQDIPKEELYQFVDWSEEREFAEWCSKRYSDFDEMSRSEQIDAYEIWLDERTERLQRKKNDESTES